MGFSTFNPPTISFEQANPMFAALPYMQSAISFPQQLRQQLLDNQIKQVQANFAQPMAQQSLQKATLDNQWMPKLNQSIVGLQGAEASNYNTDAQKNQFLMNNPGLMSMSPEAQTVALSGMQNANPLYRQLAQAMINKEQQMGNYYGMGGGRQGVDQQNMNGLIKQVSQDFPQQSGESLNDYQNRINMMKNAYLGGTDKLANGQETPQATPGINQWLLYAQGKNAPMAVKNQAANYDTLYNDLNNVDINALKSFAGPQGVARLAAARAQMVANPNDPMIDPMARRYITATKNAILTMDMMRKSFGTSVVPDYVYQTLGRLSNPNDSMWQDPKQIEQNFNQVVKTIKDNRDSYMAKAKRGVTAEPTQAETGVSNNAASSNVASNSVSTKWVRKNGKLVQQ